MGRFKKNFREANNYADALERLRVSHNGSLVTYDVCPQELHSVYLVDLVGSYPARIFRM